MNKPKHILKAKDFTRPWLEEFWQSVKDVKNLLQSRANTEHLRSLLVDKILYTFFSEESSRTRISFETAGLKLGMDIVSTQNGRVSSEAKGESWEDTMHVLCGYRPDAIVVRHKDDDAAETAASVSALYGHIPIINGGSGKKHHPTQSLIDLFTIQERLGRLDNLTVTIGADVFYSRTARSLAYLLSKFKDNTILFVTPEELRPPEELRAHLREHKVVFEQAPDMRSAFSQSDVIYWGRLQTERLPDATPKERMVRDLILSCYDKYRIDLNEVACFKSGAILMHPMPINGETREIAERVKRKCRECIIYEQSANGIPVRMALLLALLGPKR